MGDWGDLDDFAFAAAYGDGTADSIPVDEEIIASLVVETFRSISMEELSKHNTPEDCWVALYGRVYDLTVFAKGHVGGSESITRLGGTEGTVAFARKHGQNVLNSLSKDVIMGELPDLSKVETETQSWIWDGQVVTEMTKVGADLVVVAADKQHVLPAVNAPPIEDTSNTSSSPPAKRLRLAESGDVSMGTPRKRAIVIGGGLSGVSAANTVIESGGRVVILEKAAFCGGNSTKASSGINGAGTQTQNEQGIQDSAAAFMSDTLSGGAKSSLLARRLCENSGDAIAWLQGTFKIDLSKVGRLGGHSQPRTHRGKERFPGMTITYALLESLEKIAERRDLAEIITKARVTKLLTNSQSECIGCEYMRNGIVASEHGPVIIATGGFAADFGNDSLLAQYRPDLIHLPTTNCEGTTGDGIKLGQAIGARTLDLEWVQVHPTGLVSPHEPDAKVKFLAAEALRGAGGIIINGEGRRFVNELGRRDDVTGEMWKNKPPFRLLLNNAAAQEVIWHCKHYEARGMMSCYRSGAELAAKTGIPLSVLQETHEAHYQAAKQTEEDPQNGPWSAYPSGRSWDEVSGKSGGGKRFFQNVINGSQCEEEPFYAALITPVLHYCMGGLEANADAAVLGSSGHTMPGLWAVGEVLGGVHGNNRLGGNSLLDCVVFGRIAGRESVKHMLGGVSPVSLADVVNNAQTHAKTAAPNEIIDNRFTLEEVSKHNHKTDCWIVVNGKVVDVTHFINDHPGGALSILTYAGKDATTAFDMVHPVGALDKYASGMVIGHLEATVPDVISPNASRVKGIERQLPALLWCPCCREQLKGDRNDSSAQCDTCAIEVSIKRQCGS